VKVIQGLCFMLAAVVGMLLVGAFMVNSASAQPRTAPLVSEPSQCVGPCSTGQTLNLTILPPGATPPPPPTTPPVTTPPAVAPIDDGAPGAGKGGTNAGGTTKLPKTGPKETAIAAVIGFLLLQCGLVLSVRTARAVPRTSH
jgi:LPXTG-motif cell wall-anchored protein